MTQAVPQQDRKGQQLPVFRAADFRVVNGANEGDALSFAAELMLDDLYELRQGAYPTVLAMRPSDDGSFAISETSSVGRPFATLYLDCSITLMQSSGDTVEALILVEVDEGGNVADIYLHAFAPINPKMAYTLVGIDRENAHRRLALTNCVSFTRGTHVTMANGIQKPVEQLSVGDKVLTRDAGAQEVRWIGRSTVRAMGPFAPIVIKAGALNNLNDLLVNPDHRLFVYQREDKLNAGRAEVMIKARYLLNGDSVYVQNGGFVEYFQLLFDDHHIIFAEGIAAETMLVDDKTESVLPKALGEKFRNSQPGLSNPESLAVELNERLLLNKNAANLLRRASSR
ncbi:Hint domain-containing protein [Cognatishimia activa]|uniref:Hint domain-containing protein n=1 Tax=Cognatishimia activa TaxID=1715691 RepID=UPI00222F2A63|nr:Hint domain-containing protein [Cognatishimia activa]UZD91898.1 Hint domain-containing protein [Cognatishimia activa]